MYACGQGRLELTLLGKSGAPIAIRANGIPRQVVAPPPGGLWQGSVASPPNADGTLAVVFEIDAVRARRIDPHRLRALEERRIGLGPAR